MILFPAIDLKDGNCVRLLHGDMDQVTIYNADPVDQAQWFMKAGFEWLHMVDLNGAVEGRSVNSDAVDAVLEAVTVPVQLGGGIRDLDAIASWLSRGVNRVILGTIALRDPDLVKQACREHPGQVAVGIDARCGRVAVEGWVETSEVAALDLALRFEDAGVSAIIYTDIARDGALTGANVEATADLAAHLTTPVIASGGVSSLADIQMLRELEQTGIVGAICGRALYDGRLDPKQALSAAKSAA